MTLALYHYDACFFCRRVRQVIDELGEELPPIELRDVRREPVHRAELIAARGRGTVPVLRIERDDGEVTWLPESRDIIAFLGDLVRDSA